MKHGESAGQNELGAPSRCGGAAEDTSIPGMNYEPGTRVMYGSVVALQLSGGVLDAWLTLCMDLGAKVAAGGSTSLGSHTIDGAPSWCEIGPTGPWATTSSETSAPSHAAVSNGGSDTQNPEIEVAGVTRKRRVQRILQTCAFRIINANSPSDRSSIMSKDCVAFEVILNGRATGWCLGSRVRERVAWVCV